MMSFDPHMEIGEVVSNQKIVDTFKVDGQQGIRTSQKYNYIVIISKNINKQYEDQWKSEDVIYYTGAGLKGDQALTGRNKTLANAYTDGKEIFFFESEEKGKYIYRGLCDLIGEPIESTQKDDEGNLRKVYLFPLKLHHKRKNIYLSQNEKTVNIKEEENYHFIFSQSRVKKVNSQKKFEYALKPKKRKHPITKDGVLIYERSIKVASNALDKAKHQCEYDITHQSFIRKNIDEKYTEPHHLVPMAYSYLFDVSLDVEENIVSLCSHCHNCIHYGRDRFILLKKLYNERKEMLKKVGINITFNELKQMYE